MRNARWLEGGSLARLPGFRAAMRSSCVAEACLRCSASVLSTAFCCAGEALGGARHAPAARRLIVRGLWMRTGFEVGVCTQFHPPRTVYPIPPRAYASELLAGEDVLRDGPIEVRAAHRIWRGASSRREAGVRGQAFAAPCIACVSAPNEQGTPPPQAPQQGAACGEIEQLFRDVRRAPRFHPAPEATVLAEYLGAEKVKGVVGHVDLAGNHRAVGGKAGSLPMRQIRGPRSGYFIV